MRARRLLPAVLGGAALYFAVLGGEYNLPELWRLERQQRREAAEFEVLRAEVERLRARADSLESDRELLERLARERFGMIRDGERLYRFDQSATPTPAGKDPISALAEARR
ncbi:MAG TPA: septum formation initiator family protein [Longimicrobiales bacterium]